MENDFEHPVAQVGIGETGTPRKSPRITSVLALLFYQAVAAIYYGRPLWGRFETFYAGQSSDPAYYLWCMVWWPYALSHRINPFLTKLLWAPEGFNVAWSTSIPLLSFIAAPITLTHGPVVAFNLLNLWLPALTAWSGFMLFRHILGRTAPALLGGYLFGFSPFMAAAQAAGHVVFTGAFFIPTAIYLVLARLEGTLSLRWFVMLLTITILGQFLISIEVLATMVMFGAIALVAAAFFWPDKRAPLRSIGIAISATIAASALILSPYLYYMLRASGAGLRPVWSGTAASDLLEFIVPTRVMMVGLLPPLRAIAAHYIYDSYVWDSGAYTTLPVLAVAVVFLRSQWRKPSSKFLTLMIVTIVVAMLGRHLRIGGHNVAKLPWLLIGALPFINSAVAARFAIYFHLLLGLVVASWMAERPPRALLKSGVAALILLAQLPNPHASFWVRPLNVPAFFTSSYRRTLREGETVLVLPYGTGDAMLWQIYSGMYFALPEGWTGPIPSSFQAWPIVGALRRGIATQDDGNQFDAFLSAHGVSTILIDPNFPRARFWISLLQAQGAQVEEIDGVILVRRSQPETCSNCGRSSRVRN